MSKILDLREIQNNFGSAFLDNLTISCAVRLLLGYEPQESNSPFSNSKRRLYGDRGVHEGGGKWDYALNEAFRLAVDLFSLGQLVESMVIFDKLFIDSAWADRWGGMTINQDRMEFPSTVSPLEKVIVPLSMPFDKRLTFLALAASKAKLYSQSNGFPNFLRLLSATSTENVFISISNGYFQTGYSDNGLFPLDEVISLNTSYYNDPVIRQHRLDADAAILANGSDQSYEMDITAYQESKIQAMISDAWETLSRSTVLIHKKSQTDFHEKLTASPDVMRNAVAAFYYHAIATHCDLQYFPHLLRSSFVGFDQITREEVTLSTASRITQCLDTARKRRVDPINAFYRGKIIDIEIPTLFSEVLRSVTSPDRILNAAIQLRNTAEARTFRKWASETDRKLSEGTADLSNLRKEICEIQSLLAQWANNLSGHAKRGSLKLSVGLGAVEFSDTIPLPNWLTVRKRHLIFLQRMSQVSDRTVKFTKLIDKVFGSEIATVYRKYQSVVTAYRGSVNMTEDLPSPLDCRN